MSVAIFAIEPENAPLVLDIDAVASIAEEYRGPWAGGTMLRANIRTLIPN